MDLRFYRTGTIAKAPIHPQDIEDIVALLKRLQPAQIYVAGELSDPHGTHRVCAEAIFEAVRQVRKEGQQFEVWLYRGAWEEWEPHEIERVVPLSPDDLERKKQAIFRHQSQKDRAMFPGGTDRREFWQRAEDRNRDTAKVYDKLGLAGVLRPGRLRAVAGPIGRAGTATLLAGRRVYRFRRFTADAEDEHAPRTAVGAAQRHERAVADGAARRPGGRRRVLRRLGVRTGGGVHDPSLPTETRGTLMGRDRIQTFTVVVPGW